MQIIDLATEQTAAVTDILLAILAAYVAISLHQYRTIDSFKVRIWTWTLSLVTLAAVLGTLVHGLEMQAGLRQLI